MHKPIRVRVKGNKAGYIYGLIRKPAIHNDKGNQTQKADEFTLIPVTYIHKKDDNGKPLVKTPEQQFSSKWMERLDPIEMPGKDAETNNTKPNGFDGMTVKMLKAALNEANITIPQGAVKADLIVLLAPPE